MTERKRKAPDHTWSTRYFEDEERSEPVTRRRPPGAPALRAGDRVSFDLGEGVDAPPYAMNVVVTSRAD